MRVDVHLWEIHVSSHNLAGSADVLTEDELKRMNRLHFNEDRNRYLVAHAALRRILGERLKTDPREISFESGKLGKPYIPESRLKFNLSHSGDWVWIAVCDDFEIGVDIEQMKEIDASALMQRFGSAEEAELFSLLPEQQHQQAFFTWWTRKEAYLKGAGSGLSGGLQSFTAWKGSADPLVLHVADQKHSAGGHWTIQSPEASTGYCGAIAVSHTDINVVRKSL